MIRTRNLILSAALIPMLLSVATPAMALMRPRPVPIDPPVYPEPPAGYIYRWVEPVFQTITERIWVPEQSQQVEDWVMVSPDRMQRIWRTVIIPAHYETVTRRELVSAGHWQLVLLSPPPPPVVFRNPPIVSVEGYSQLPTEDLSKFSGLSEWPERN